MNVTIAVIDCGIDAAHPELANTVADAFDALGSKDGPHAHGTAVAGVIAARVRLTGSTPEVRDLGDPRLWRGRRRRREHVLCDPQEPRLRGGARRADREATADKPSQPAQAADGNNTSVSRALNEPAPSIASDDSAANHGAAR
ncbi:subtilisin family serine protease [Bradyrhizobium embrapense]